MINRPLPSFCYPGRRLQEVGAIVAHAISAINVSPRRPFDPDAIYDLFLDLNSPGSERGRIMQPDPGAGRLWASAQYLIGRDGAVYQLLDEQYEAWHAGRSEWRGRSELNKWSIGVEWIGAHPDAVRRRGLPPELAEFTDEQYRAGQQLYAELMTRYRLGVDDLPGHSDVSPGRKWDPGPKFDRDRFIDPLRYVGVTV